MAYLPAAHATGSDIVSEQRKMRRACDHCHRRKVRCNGREMPGNKCSNCTSSNVECTYAVPLITKRRGSRAYVQDLEKRLGNAEKLLSLLSPETNLNEILEHIDGKVLKPKKPQGQQKSNDTPLVYSLATLSLNTELHDAGKADSNETPLNGGDYNTVGWNDQRNSLSSLGNQKLKFFGKSSHLSLVQSAMDLKKEWSEEPPTAINNNHINGDFFKGRRPEFWNFGDWKKPIDPPPPNYDFPEPDLLVSLVDLYFSTLNNFFPLLHRPTFESSLAQDLHLYDQGFGAVALLVCAIGARFSDDLRVMYQSSSPHWAGFTWFHQVQNIKRGLLTPPSIYDVQVYCLSAIFLDGISPHYLRWNLIGVGLRSLQEMGAHRHYAYAHPSIEGELWKRAFWILMVLDRMTSSGLGRVCALREEDFDLELPTECDDEFWDNPDPEQRFKQPSGTPSKISYFIQLAKLNQVHAFGLRTIFAMGGHLSSERRKEWNQRMLAEVTSSMSKWMEHLPDHLRWDPNREDDLFFRQSAILHSHYYNIQIWIHRAFIKAKSSPSSSASFAICTNAARSCCALIHIARPRLGAMLFMSMKALASAAVVFLLNIWSRRPFVDPVHEMGEVNKILEVLKSLEDRWQMGGRAIDIINSLIYARTESDFVLENTALLKTQKGINIKMIGSSAPPPGFQPTYHRISPVTSPDYRTPGSSASPQSPAEPWTPFEPTTVFERSPPGLKDPEPELDLYRQEHLGSIFTSGPSLGASGVEEVDMSVPLALNAQFVSPSFLGSAETGLDDPMTTCSLRFLQQQPQPGSGTADGLLGMSCGGKLDLPTMDVWEDWESYISSMDTMVKILQDNGEPA